MDNNTKKKLLYKQKPKAYQQGTTSTGELIYVAMVDDGNKDNAYMDTCYFHIPEKEAQNFQTSEPAQLLIRWLMDELDTDHIAIKGDA